MLRESIEGELLAQLARAVLAGEHALLPEGVALRTCVNPLDGGHPLGEVVVADAFVSERAGQILITQPHPLAFQQHFGVFGARCRRLQLAVVELIRRRAPEDIFEGDLERLCSCLVAGSMTSSRDRVETHEP